MSNPPHRSSRHATPTPSRPGTPSGSRRPSLHTHRSIPSIALANASLQASASVPQISKDTSALIASNTVAISKEQAAGVLSSAASISGEADSSSNTSFNGNGMIAGSQHGSNEHLTIPGDEGHYVSLRPPEEVAADAHKLREHLRRSLSRGKEVGSSSRSKSHSHADRADIRELSYELPVKKRVKRQFFVLTHAGKPVFLKRDEDEETSSEEDTNLIGVMHALISVFEDDQDKIRSIIAPPARITFMIRPPLYYVCTSPSNEPESIARIYLEHLHLLILSVLTSSQLERILTRHTNFDLRRLLSGTTTMLQSHLQYLPSSFGILTSSLNTLRLEASLRLRVADALVPPPNMKSKLKDILYAMVIVDERVVTIARPRKHTVHPADIHVLLATVGSPAVRGNSGSWLPICLPKFNPNGLLHAYASYLTVADAEVLPPNPTADSPIPQPSNSIVSQEERSEGEHQEPTENHEDEAIASSVQPSEAPLHSPVPSICLVIVSASGDFETVRRWADVASERLNEAETLKNLVKSARTNEYSVDELGIPGVRHFFYKSRTNVQVTAPKFEGVESLGEEDENGRKEREWERLLELYRLVWDAIHAKSGQECTLKLQYVRTEGVCVMGWITQTFEIYVALSPRLPKSAAVGAANAVVKWVKQEESRLFLKDAPVF